MHILSNYIENKRIGICVVFLAIAIAIAVIWNIYTAFPIFIAFLLYGYLCIAPLSAILFFLSIRSGLDIFTDIGFNLGPLVFNIPSLAGIFLLTGGGVYLLLTKAPSQYRGANHVGNAFFLWIASLGVWVAFAYAHFKIDGIIALREWMRLASFYIIYLLSYRFTVTVGYQKMTNVLLWALPIPLIIGFWQMVSGHALKVGGIYRIQGTIAHPNAFALFLVLFIGLVFWKARFSLRPFWWYVVLLLQAIALINTFSISGMIMFSLVAGIVAIQSTRQRVRFVIAGFVLIALAAFLLSPYGRERAREISETGNVFEDAQSSRFEYRNSLTWRILNWSLFIREWQKSPAFGYGLATTTSDEMISPLKNQVHNDYLRLLVETGIPGLLIYLWFLMQLGRALSRSYRYARKVSAEFSLLALINGAVCLAWCMGSFFDNYLTATTFQYYFWSLTGVTLSYTEMARLQHMPEQGS